jgi:ABC-type amino acid transport substrate-binding protein
MKKLISFAFAVILLISGCRGNDAPPNTVYSADDLPGRIIGVLHQSSSARFAHEIGGGVLTFHSVDELLAALRTGRIDAALMEMRDAQAIASRASGVTILPEPLVEYDLRIAVARENAPLLDAVNSALAELDENGTLGGLYNRYFRGRDFTYQPPETAGDRPGSLTIAVPYYFPPYVFIGDSGQRAGMDIAVARAVADIVGVEFEIIPIDTGALITAVWFGHADLALGFTPWDDGWDDGESPVSFSNAYARSTQAIIVRR